MTKRNTKACVTEQSVTSTQMVAFNSCLLESLMSNTIDMLTLASVAFMFWNIVVAKNDCKPKDCYDLKCYMLSTAKDGPHIIYPGRPDLTSLEVSCDQETKGGGWVIYLRRVDGSVNFTRNWADYRNGFGRHGDDTTELWLGNENVYQLLQSYGSTECEFRIEGYAFDGDTCSIDSANFKMRPESDKYAITWDKTTVNNTNESTWDYHKSQTFKTIDNNEGGNCAGLYHGGWWYRDCANTVLTGLYYPVATATHSAMIIGTFKTNLSLKASVMMFRPTDSARACSNPCKNGGTCEYEAASQSHRCVCPSTHCGASCAVMCRNSGMCEHNLTTNATKCFCTAGHTGPECDTKQNVTDKSTDSNKDIIGFVIGVVLGLMAAAGALLSACFLYYYNGMGLEAAVMERQRLLNGRPEELQPCSPRLEMQK